MRISDWSSDVCSSDLKDPLMRRWIFGLLALLLMAAAAFFLLAPGIIERGVNKVEGGPLPQVGEQARALHRTLAIVDLHSDTRSEEHPSELQSLMRISYAVFCLKKQIKKIEYHVTSHIYKHNI